MMTAIALLAYYTLLILWLTHFHRRETGRSLLADVRENTLVIVLLAAVWAPAIVAGVYWFMTGRSILTLVGW